MPNPDYDLAAAALKKLTAGPRGPYCGLPHVVLNDESLSIVYDLCRQVRAERDLHWLERTTRFSCDVMEPLYAKVAALEHFRDRTKKLLRFSYEAPHRIPQGFHDGDIANGGMTRVIVRELRGLLRKQV